MAQLQHQASLTPVHTCAHACHVQFNGTYTSESAGVQSVKAITKAGVHSIAMWPIRKWSASDMDERGKK